MIPRLLHPVLDQDPHSLEPQVSQYEYCPDHGPSVFYPIGVVKAGD